MIETAQDQHLAARQERGVEFEARILRGRADQRDGAVFDVGQETILLGTIEAMDLVHEEQGPLTRSRGSLGFGENLLEVRYSRKDCSFLLYKGNY